MELNSLTAAATIDLEYEAVPSDQLVAGHPQTGAHVLADFNGVEVGVWEMTAGSMSDVEADEVFVVLSGTATIEFDDGTPALHVGAGDVVRFAEGAKTVWTVTEPLRKIYLTRG